MIAILAFNCCTSSLHLRQTICRVFEAGVDSAPRHFRVTEQAEDARKGIFFRFAHPVIRDLADAVDATVRFLATCPVLM